MSWFPWSRKKPSEDSSSGDPVLERVATDIKKYGWHLLAITQHGGAAGFLYTVGLWSTYQHPEIVLFSTGTDPTKLAGNVKRMVEKIANGERYEPGGRYNGAFGDFPGAVRAVDQRWYPYYLGTGSAHYGHFDYPAVQLFWPDAERRFPWQSEYDLSLVDQQRLLFNANPLLANLSAEETAAFLENDGDAPFREGLEQLCVPLEGSAIAAFEEWQWLIGDDVRPFRLTLFGDLLLKDSAGRFHFLGCGYGEMIELASDESSLWSQLALHAEAIFHRRLLLHIREIGWEIPEGHVYSPTVSPQLGGPENLDNLGYAPARVHLSNSARETRALADLNDATSTDRLGPRQP